MGSFLDFIQNIFDYPIPFTAGIIPYLNFVVGLKVLVGLRQ
jgi:energy-converting hydrogenase B subunit I